MKRSPLPPAAMAILTDVHFWLPLAVLAAGIGLLFFVSRT